MAGGSEVGGDMRRVTNNHVTRDINNRDIPMTHSHLRHSSLSPIFCKNIVKHLYLALRDEEEED